MKMVPKYVMSQVETVTVMKVIIVHLVISVQKVIMIQILEQQLDLYLEHQIAWVRVFSLKIIVQLLCKSTKILLIILECQCYPAGSVSCVRNGNCDCHDGYTGDMCELCATGYFKQDSNCVGNSNLSY